MKTERNILIAFILNLLFSIFELVGGVLTGSVAIVSDAVHDAGDALSIGLSFFLEKKSKKQADKKYTYGYGRYSVLGGLITTMILLVGSVVMIYNAIGRILTPTEINYNGMIVFAMVGVCVNFIAALFTREGDSINQKAVNLHMLEDVLGWVVVLVGAIVMRFTDFALLDPILSICVSAFILYNAIKNFAVIVALFLEKTPQNVDLEEIQTHICEIDGVLDIHHIHIWSVDGVHHSATMHIVTETDPQVIKAAVRVELAEHGIVHSTLELENPTEDCHDMHCHIEHTAHSHHHHHHH